MTKISGNERANNVRVMFTRIAGHYDRANRWMTWGQDVKWRREVLSLAQLPMRGRLLDIGTGTGDLALEALQRDKTLFAIGADFTSEMMQHGRNRRGGEWIKWINADALELPFDGESFDAVVSGYLLRNVNDIEKALSEQYRVLKQDGHVVCLDTTPPPDDIWHLPARFYLLHFIPIIGRLITGDNQAYQYLPESTEQFIRAEGLSDRMRVVGFRDVHFRRFMGGTMAIHWGEK